MSRTGQIIGRRSFMAGMGASAGALGLSGCQGLGGLGGFGLEDALRRILLLSSERAFARLTAPGGWYDGQISRLALGEVLGSRGDILSSILTTGLVKNALEREFANIAVEGAERAAPILYDTVRTIGFANTIALIRGGPTAATSFLRGEMGGALVDAMVPEVGEAMRISREPAVGAVLGALTGTDITRTVNNFSREVDDAIWGEIGNEEAAIRRNPRSTNDPVIIGALSGLG